MPRSVATIDSPEFINVRPYNPLISECEIKVLYVGENRNKSFISKQVAIEMANSLPGCPIVGYYIEDKGDFADHGQRVTIEGGKVQFETMTRPYGFVAPDAKIWFKKFIDTDEFGNEVEREYLMTNGYLWTGQYAEAQRIIDQGNGQSMELDEKTLDGKWAINQNTGVEFLIINDAIFSKLAILGEDVEPCFEGADITAPKVSSTFTMNEEFTHTLFSMMTELKTALEESSEGGLNMHKENKELFAKKLSEMTPEEVAALTPEEKKKLQAEEAAAKEKVTKNDLTVEEAVAEDAPVEEVLDVIEDETPAEEVEVGAEDAEFNKNPDDQCKTDANEDADETEVDEDNKDGKKFELSEEEFTEFQKKYDDLEAEVIALREYKANAEDAQKDALIESFYMLSDEDKAEVIENKANYSLDDIEAKLAVICVRNKVSFTVEDEDDTHEDPNLTFNLDGAAQNVPAYVQAILNAKKND